VTTTLVALAVVMATVIWWLVRTSVGARPWVEERPGADHSPTSTLPLPTIKIGLGVFMAVATSLFALSISAYLMRREGVDWRPLAPPMVLWFNTASLALGSVFFQRARNASRSGQAAGMRRGLLAGGACTLAFLAGQFWAWRSLDAAGYYVASNPANAFFYFLTALHGLHLLGGLWVWGATLVKMRRGAALEQVRMSVELCTAYWHFLLVIWMILFGVLLFT